MNTHIQLHSHAPQAQELHARALEAVNRYARAETDLLIILQRIDQTKAFRTLGYSSLFAYAVEGLKLSESTAYNFINVARKAAQIPALEIEITQGFLSVSKARKIVPVVTLENQREWIEKAKSLPQRALEKEVARMAPKMATPETARYVTESRIKLSLGVEETLMEDLKRVQDLESQRTGKAVSLEETLQELVKVYLEKRDPIEKSKRAKSIGNETSPPVALGQLSQTAQTPGSSRSFRAPESPQFTQPPRSPIPAALRHRVTLRDQRRCTELNPDGSRCSQRRWLDIHHLKPLSEGGIDALENLVTLCGAHHRQRHAPQKVGEVAWIS